MVPLPCGRMNRKCTCMRDGVCSKPPRGFQSLSQRIHSLISQVKPCIGGVLKGQEHHFKPYSTQVQMTELFQLYNLCALDKSIIGCYYLTKMFECKRARRYDVGFIDPYIVNEYTLKNHPKDAEEDLCRFLTENNFIKEILFPYNFKFHWILLNIQVDKSLVEVHDSLSWDQEQGSDMKAMFHKCWTRFRQKILGPFKEELTYKMVKSL